MAKKPKDITARFGIGEWFGKVLTQMDSAERRYYASEVLKEKKYRRLYAYKADEKTGRATGDPVPGPQGELRATCPYRFHEALDVFHWVGETALTWCS